MAKAKRYEGRHKTNPCGVHSPPIDPEMKRIKDEASEYIQITYATIKNFRKAHSDYLWSTEAKRRNVLKVRALHKPGRFLFAPPDLTTGKTSLPSTQHPPPWQELMHSVKRLKKDVTQLHQRLELTETLLTAGPPELSIEPERAAPQTCAACVIM